MAVVGNVGTYATVQPIEGPNFGGMVQDQFDKLDAERKAKAKAEEEAKAKKQAQLDKLSLPEQEMLNLNGFQAQRYNWLKSQVPKFRELRDKGDYNEAQRLINSLETEANAVKQTNAKLKYYYDNRGDYDDAYFRRFEDMMKYTDSGNIDLVDKGDGEVRYNIYKDPAKTEILYEAITPYEFVSKSDIPLKFDTTKEVELFTKTFKLDEIEQEIDRKASYGTIQAKDLVNNERVLSRIDEKAEEYIDDDRAMAHYGKTINKWSPRAKDYTDKEKEDAKKYFAKLLKDGYEKELDMQISQKSQARGGSGKDGMKVGTPTLWDSSTINIEEPGSAPGRTSIKKVPVTAGKAKTTTISNSTGKTLLVNSMPLDRVLYDPDTDQMYIGIAFNASSRESMGNNGSGASEGSSNKVTKWFPSNSSEFNAFKTVYNSSFGTDLQTIDDFKRALFIDRGI